MNRSRKVLAAATATALGSMLWVVPATAVADASPAAHTAPAVTAAASKSLPVSGKTSNGQPFQGQISKLHAANVNGTPTLSGVITGSGLPPGGTPFSAPMRSAVANATPAGACSVLNLNLGPLHLNLLGLTIDLNQVLLDINAVPGGGALLGNLLCAVTHLLDAGQLLGLLNILNQILSGLGLGG